MEIMILCALREFSIFYSPLLFHSTRKLANDWKCLPQIWKWFRVDENNAQFSWTCSTVLRIGNQASKVSYFFFLFFWEFPSHFLCILNTFCDLVRLQSSRCHKNEIYRHFFLSFRQKILKAILVEKYDKTNEIHFEWTLWKRPNAFITFVFSNWFCLHCCSSWFVTIFIYFVHCHPLMQLNSQLQNAFCFTNALAITKYPSIFVKTRICSEVLIRLAHLSLTSTSTSALTHIHRACSGCYTLFEK